MKTDRNLVDAAAKVAIAAGLRLVQRSGADATAEWVITFKSTGSTPVSMPWEPLDNDADACSLIVAIPLAVDFEDNAVYIHHGEQLIWEAIYSGDADRGQITRRAIVLAVASLAQLHR